MKFNFKLVRKFLPVLVCALILPLLASSQDSAAVYPAVTRSRMEYRAQVLQDSSKKMLSLAGRIQGVSFDLRYAGKNNFVGKRMYPSGTRNTFLRSAAVAALKKVALELDTLGYALKIFDGYRPFSVTIAFWELVKDERYVANPSKGSGHNRGIAIDLTLVHKKTKKEVDMGTGFDNFSDTAHHSFAALPKEVLSNRQLLRSVMERHGFRAFETEWWHYYFADGKRYELLDLKFEEL